MDPERERIQADLRGIVGGQVRCDDLTLQMYASDASIYEVRPLAVVRPNSDDDVVATVQYAEEHNIPIQPRGAGSGLAGETLGEGIVLDFSYNMRRLLEIGDEVVRAQVGLPLAELNRRLAPLKRTFGPDPANRGVSTLGSVVALDASGSHWPVYGSTRRHVRSMKAVLTDGRHLEFHHQHPLKDPSDPTSQLSHHLAQLLQRHAKTIEQYRPQTTVNRCGYHLYDLLDSQKNPEHIDLARLLVGSEGTLAITTEVTLDTVPLPKHRGVALLLFDRLELAARAALELRRYQPWACDLLDRRLLRLACESDVRFQLLLPTITEASLLVEMQHDDPSEVRGRLQQMVHVIQRKKKLAFDAKLALEEEEVGFYWKLAEHVVPTLYRLKGQTRALPFVEDIAIPPAQLPSFLVTLQNVLKQHEVTASLFAHAAHGQLHIRPFLDLADLTHVDRLHQLAKDLYHEVIEIGGTISGEHGLGLSRTWYLRQQFGPLYDVFAEVKALFDPSGILNPGKVVTRDAQPITHNLRPVTQNISSQAAGARERQNDLPLVDLQLSWSTEDLTREARACNGCGNCQSLSAELRMCPIFRLGPSEEASPRAKANLMRAMATGRLAWETLENDAMKETADLCFHCHQCRLECPARVDIPKLMTESKAQYVATNGMPLADHWLGRVDLLCNWGSRFRWLSNWALGNRQMRWLLEKGTGISQSRHLPRFSDRSFLRSQPRTLTRLHKGPGRKVVYFVDIYANYFDVELGQALIQVLGHHGIGVYIPPVQFASGMAMIAQGNLDRARVLARRNVDVLAEAVRQGYEIVATEPSAALALKHEYLHLFQDEDVQLVADHTLEACDYLWRMHQAGELELDLAPLNLNVAYHEPCHSRAMSDNRSGELLLRLIPGLSVNAIDRGCSGMAGTYGLKRQNFRKSLRMGIGLIREMRSANIQVGSTECSACKLQMQQGTSKPTLHPIKLLAAAYGLSPGAARLLGGESYGRNDSISS